LLRERFENNVIVIIALALVAMVLVAFWAAGGNQFLLFDDNVYVTENETVLKGLTWEGTLWAFTATHAGNWHPLTSISHMVDVQSFGLNPRGHHLTNILFHALNTGILFLLLKAMTGALWRSALVAALFAVHPLHVESVVWVAERKDVLSTLFWLLTMWAYYWYTRQPGISRYLPVVLFFGLGLMAKPMLVTLPFILLLLDFWPLQRWKGVWSSREAASPLSLPPAGRILLWEKIPLFALTAASSVVTFLVQRRWGAVASMEEHPFISRLSNALVSYAAYIVKMFWPSRLSALYPFQQDGLPLWQIAGSVLMLSIISILVVLAIRRYPYLAVGWFWYLGTLVPVIGLVQVGYQAMADRYTYVPLIGLFIALSWGAADLSERWLKSPGLTAVAGMAVLMPLVAVTRAQTEHWKDSITLFSHVLDVTSDNWVAEYNIGTYLDDQGRSAEAVSHYGEAVRIRPEMWQAHFNMGKSLALLGDDEKAIAHCREVIRLKPGFLDARNLLAISLDKQGRFEESMAQYREAIQIDPSRADTLRNMGHSLFLQGKFGEAETLLRKVLQTRPDYADAHQTLGVVLAKRGRKAEAIGHYGEALRLQPDSARTYYNMANSQADVGMLDEAVENYRQALRIDHDFYDAHFNLARILTVMGRIVEGVEQYRTALSVNPDALDALNNLSWLFSTHYDPEMRNASESIKLARRVCELTNYQNPFYLDTLAAAYAEAGRFDAAVETARKAAVLARSSRDDGIYDEILNRLESYESGKPFRDE